MIMGKNYDPVIVFAFSKRDCEALAMQMGKLSFTTDDEKEISDGRDGDRETRRRHNPSRDPTGLRATTGKAPTRKSWCAVWNE